MQGLEGAVLLDGSWNQAKTLWWRNPWVLKAKRIALKLMAPAVKAFVKLLPRQGNQFGFVITKTGRLRDWLEEKDGKVRLSPERAEARGHLRVGDVVDLVIARLEHQCVHDARHMTRDATARLAAGRVMRVRLGLRLELNVAIDAHFVGIGAELEGLRV